MVYVSTVPHLSRRVVALVALFLSLGLCCEVSAQNPCTVVDAGSGTVSLPPVGCAYLSPTEVHMIINGLPPGTTIELSPIHRSFFNVAGAPGGRLGGEAETFDSTLNLAIAGTGDLSAFTRVLDVPVTVETHTGPRLPGESVQSFATDMFRIAGELFGDPDFCTFRVTAGTDNAMPSPGRTTLTQLPSGDWNVDSFFDIEYQIEFQGCPGSPLDGFAGTTTDTIRMAAGEPVPPPCTVVDNGTGTVDLPPSGCGYVSPDDLHVMIAGLPPGTEIRIDPVHSAFFNISQGPGGGLGGEFERFDSTLDMQMQGTGALAGFRRRIALPLLSETHIGPRTPGAPVQSFPTQMFDIHGALSGDPDFAQLQVAAGVRTILPVASLGQTTLTQMSGGKFHVDSFFDITYEINFVGAPGGLLDGLSGTTQAVVHMEAVALPQPGGCCMPTGECVELLTEECFGAGGSPQGQGSSCSEFPTGLPGAIAITCPPPATTTTTLPPQTTTTTLPPQTTTTTLPSSGGCGDPIGASLAGGGPPALVTASDALFVLRAGIGLEVCAACVCDVNGSGSTTASDALTVLKFAVGANVTLSCPAC